MGCCQYAIIFFVMEESQGDPFCTSKPLLVISGCLSPPPRCNKAMRHHKGTIPGLTTLFFSVLYALFYCCFIQSLLTGLMYYRPDDPIDYLEGCLKKVMELGGPDKVRWDTFIGQEKKSLPPLNGGQSRRALFRNGEQWGMEIWWVCCRSTERGLWLGPYCCAKRCWWSEEACSDLLCCLQAVSVQYIDGRWMCLLNY